jgi:hypothetical protein
MRTYKDKRGIEWFFHCLICGEALPLHSHSLAPERTVADRMYDANQYSHRSENRDAS